jgi:DNA-binding CsgD family transcriptional regulator
MRMAKAALDLALNIGDDWIVSYCANRLAGTQFYAGDPGAYETYRVADERLLIGGSTASADLVALNRVSWASVAVARGEYALASRLFSDGVVTAHTPRFADLFASFAELVALRTKGPRAVKVPEVTGAGPIGRLVAAEVALEVDRAPDAVALDGLIEELAFVPFLQWVARSVQARLRALRNEPAPARDLGPVMEHIAGRGIRSGWEDAAVALAEIDGPHARERFESLDSLWADTPRARAAHLLCRSLVQLEEDAFGSLIDAADLFERLPEPVTAARTLHHAARFAPDTTAGNALRRQALELLRAAGADRSAADVVRDRTLHRGEGREQVSESMRRANGGALTRREREVVDLAIAGLTATEIADQLTLSVWTVRHHLQNARHKLGGVTKRRLGETFGAS